MKIVEEEFEPGDEWKCGRLNVPMYGTRGTALRWHEHYTSHLHNLGFIPARSSWRVLVHYDRGICPSMHGDNYVASGFDEDLQWFADTMREQYECKDQSLGLDGKDEKQVEIYNRVVTWHDQRGEGLMTFEAVPRHAESLTLELG